MEVILERKHPTCYSFWRDGAYKKTRPKQAAVMKSQKCEKEIVQESKPETEKEFIEAETRKRGRKISLPKKEQQHKKL